MSRRRRLIYRCVLAAGAILIMAGPGCKHGEGASPGESGIPRDLAITCGIQGIQGGRGNGYTINGNGEVVRWEGRYPGHNRYATAVADTSTIWKLWEHAERINFLEMRDQAMAVTYWFISVSANGESRRHTWVERNEEALTPAQEFFDECMNVARTAMREEQGRE
jgi:hypothetical protein